MFRSSIFTFIIVIILTISTINGKNTNNRRLKVLSSPPPRPISTKICGEALIRLLNVVCTEAEQLINKNGISSTLSPTNRQMKRKYYPFSNKASINDDKSKINLFSYKKKYIDFVIFLDVDDNLINDCCLQACTLKKLLKYC